MKNLKAFGLIALLFFSSCSSQTATRSAANRSALEEVRIALMDVKQAHSAQQMEIELLREEIGKTKPKVEKSPSMITNIESRVRQLEKNVQTLKSDLHQLSNHANQTTKSLLEYRNQISALESLIKRQNDRLNEVVKLKGTLDSISQAIGGNAEKLHKVRSGDSLDKIARRNNTTVAEIKRINGLKSNTIFIGQELKIP